MIWNRWEFLAQVFVLNFPLSIFLSVYPGHKVINEYKEFKLMYIDYSWLCHYEVQTSKFFGVLVVSLSNKVYLKLVNSRQINSRLREHFKVKISIWNQGQTFNKSTSSRKTQVTIYYMHKILKVQYIFYNLNENTTWWVFLLTR